MPLLPNINVGSAPNDGTGDTIRNAFIKVNENFQYIEAFFPNTDVANLTANITSTGTSTFNIINAATIGNSGATLTGSTVNAATIGNSGATLTGSTVNAAIIGNAGATLVGAVVNAATIGNAGTLLSGTIIDSNQSIISRIGSSITSNVDIVGTVNLQNTSIAGVLSTINSILIRPGGPHNVGFGSNDSQTAVFTMNTNVNLNLIGGITPGVQKDFYFVNNTATLKSTNIFVYGNRTNKGTNVNIGVSSNTVALIKMVAVDSTPANIVAVITNS